MKDFVGDPQFPVWLIGDSEPRRSQFLLTKQNKELFQVEFDSLVFLFFLTYNYLYYETSVQVTLN